MPGIGEEFREVVNAMTSEAKALGDDARARK
jgi:hypothetical protein